MSTATQGASRVLIGARQEIQQEELGRLQASGALVTDDRHRRPLYFDGRFLAARDLTREQVYFLTRQADLGRAGGWGIVYGLNVSAGPTATTIRVGPGHGITPAGESVVLPGTAPFTFDLANIPEIQRLDAAFGLLPIPRDSARNRSGIFVLALRPVEFSANPIASYPTTLTGQRTVEDGDIVEGVAMTLIPYPEEGPRNELDQPRSRIAHQVFVQRNARGMTSAVLPIAVLALDRATIQWIDSFLVRREVSASQSDIVGLGLSPRSLREAHLLQYTQQFQDVLQQRTRQGRTLRFPASEHFLALPPSGQLPAQAINAADFSQLYFPAEVDVTLAIVPDDEITALVEDSFNLPPIDLTLSADLQDSTGVHVLIPLSRAQVRTFSSRLTSLTRPVKAAAPGLLARRKPLEVLQGLRLPRVPPPLIQPQDLVDTAWREALAQNQMLWYVRSRNVQYRSEVIGVSTTLTGDEADRERGMSQRLADLGATPAINRIRQRATAPANAEVVALLSSPKISSSPILTTAAVRELENTENLDRSAVLKISEKFSDPHFGEGVARLEQANPELRSNKSIVRNLASSESLKEIDQIARSTHPAQMNDLAREVETASKGKSVKMEAIRKRARSK
jgi:hypothetical protein